MYLWSINIWLSLILFQLTQEGIEAQIYNHFTVLANRVDGLPEEILLDSFVSGLKKELQA